MDGVLGFTPQEQTLSALALSAIALIITSFARGWVVAKFVVESIIKVYDLLVTASNKRADDYKEAWELSEAARKLDAAQLASLLVYAETADRILRTIPAPPSGASGEKVDP